MLSQPLTPTETDKKRRDLEVKATPPALPLADEDLNHAGDQKRCVGDREAKPVPRLTAPAFTRQPMGSSTAEVRPQSRLPRSFHLHGTKLVCSPMKGVCSPPPPPSAPCCSCASLLPRLLSSHRLEVRRLLRGALASLGRRLDSLERRSKRSRRKQKRGGGSSVLTCSSASLPPVRTSLSSSDQSPLSFSPSEQRKRRRKDCKSFNISETLTEEDEGRRFVGQMSVSSRGGGGLAEKQECLILQDFSQNKRRRREEGGVSQSEAFSLFTRMNGYSSSQNALLPLNIAGRAQTYNQEPGVFPFFSGQWHSSNIITQFSSNHSVFNLWLSHAPFHISPAPMLHLSTVAVETGLNWVRGRACWNPQHPLRDWTAPPSLNSDHCTALSARRPQRKLTNHRARSLCLPRQRALPPCSTNGLSAGATADQSAAVSEYLEVGKRVSQIRIRRAPPKETPLTPMGLPKVKRLKKKEFSLEEIYTNKNYESPHSNRSLETIFEEPREKDGALLLIGQQKRRRLLLFPDFTQPRKRKRPQGLPVAVAPRKRAAARRYFRTNGLEDDSDLDVMLVERLSALEEFLSQQGLDIDM